MRAQASGSLWEIPLIRLLTAFADTFQKRTVKMPKETLQHTMRSKVRVFEDGGIRLLRKGQKGLIHAIFSRFGLVLVLLVLQFGALFSLMRWFSNLLPHYLGGTLLVTAAMMVYLLNQDMNNSVRIPWLVVTALAPVLGVLLGVGFAGELLDTDAYTGGFNLQIAWATGRLAGQSAANEKE